MARLALALHIYRSHRLREQRATRLLHALILRHLARECRYVLFKETQGETVKKIGPWLAKRKKAIAGLVAPGAALFVVDVTDGTWPTAHEWSAVAIACVVGAIGVYIAPKNVL